MKGRWDSAITGWDVMNGSNLESGGGTHMALLRGTADSAWIVHWYEDQQARLWQAQPMSNAGPGVAVPYEGSNIFCGGHATLANGKLFVVGGTIAGVTGDKRAHTFDATRYWEASGGWALVDEAQQGQYYPTVTTLGDGKVLATGGGQWKNMVLVGGAVNSGGQPAAVNEMRLLNLAQVRNWSAEPPFATQPPPRHGHSTVVHNSLPVIFGGTSGSEPKNDLWHLYGQDFDIGRRWTWVNRTNVGADPDHGYPPRRSQHSAVLLSSGGGVDTMIVFGGKGGYNQSLGSDTLLSDVWLLRITSTTAQWKKVTTFAGDGPPGPRYGHVAAIAKTDRPQPVMVVYGGQDAAGYVDSDVWELAIARAGGDGVFTWRRMSPGGPSPGRRDGHSAVMLPVNRATAEPDFTRLFRMVMFGGRKDNGQLDHEVYELRMREGGVEAFDWGWMQPTIGTPRPPARMRHAAAWDAEFGRVVVFGGDPTPGGYASDLWELKLNQINDVTHGTWTSPAADSVPTARWGHTLVFDPRPYNAFVPEVYDPSVGTIGDWSQYPVAPKHLPYYPFTFVLPDGNVFFAGNGPEQTNPRKDQSWFYSTSQPAWTPTSRSPFLGGSAVYFPDLNKVMKCGGDDDITFTAVQDSTGIADLAGGSASWSTHPSVEKLPGSRTFHNLTVLPDGRVLVTGGRTHRNDQPSSFTKIPYLWDPADPVWTPFGGLAPDPYGRGYHSSAVLLPDGRVLCAGGPAGNNLNGDLPASIFSPPYLFATGTAEATRPVVTSHPTYTVHYDEPIYLGIGGVPIDDIGIVSLIRPGAATHGFDQNQRFAKLTFAKHHGLLRAVLPSSGNHLPPGDHLLFAVRTGVGGVPSVAKWIRVAGENDLDAPASAALTYSNVTGTSAIVKWTAPGDDGTSGTASLYDFRYRTGSPITTANFASCTTIATLPPPPTTTQEQYAVTGLNPCTIYFFGLKTRDESGNWSALTTVPVGTQGCGGGGGGEYELSARPVNGTSSPTTEHVALDLGRAGSGSIGVTLTHVGSTPITLDSLRAVRTRVGGDSIAVAGSGEIVAGALRAAEQIEAGRNDVTSAFAGSGYSAAAGESLVVTFPAREDANGAWTLAVQLAPGSGGAELARVRVLEPDWSGGWVARGSAFPSAGRAGIVDHLRADRLCLLASQDLILSAVSRLVPAAVPPLLQSVALGQAVHGRLGPLGAGDAAAGVTLEPGDVLDLRVPVGPDPETSSFLLFRMAAGTTAPLRTQPSGGATPVVFALGQNEPNPFGEGTTIRFTTPVRTRVQLDVFDVRGRRIRTLSRTEWVAGEHTIFWDGRDGQGHRVQPGIYFYRMASGSFRASRRLVMLP